MLLDIHLRLKYSQLIIEYIWLGGKNELRSKTRVLDESIIQIYSQPSDERTESLLLKKDNEPDVYVHVPHWNYDGSSTGQASGEDSEVIIKPQAIFNDPFRLGVIDNFLVLWQHWSKQNGKYRKPSETIGNH